MTDVRKPQKKSKGGRPKLYSDKARKAALIKVQEVGLAKAAMSLKIPKSTLHGWARDAGVDTVSDEAKSTSEKAVQASLMARREKIAQTRETLVENLSEIALLGTSVEMQRLKRALEAQGEDINPDRLSEIVGARTRAIHDLELLEGRATGRVETIDSVEDIRALQAELDQRTS